MHVIDVDIQNGRGFVFFIDKDDDLFRHPTQMFFDIVWGTIIDCHIGDCSTAQNQ